MIEKNKLMPFVASIVVPYEAVKESNVEKKKCNDNEILSTILFGEVGIAYDAPHNKHCHDG